MSALNTAGEGSQHCWWEVSALNTAYPAPSPTTEGKVKQTLARVFSDMTDKCGFIWATINLVKPFN